MRGFRKSSARIYDLTGSLPRPAVSREDKGIFNGAFGFRRFVTKTTVTWACTALFFLILLSAFYPTLNSGIIKQEWVEGEDQSSPYMSPSISNISLSDDGRDQIDAHSSNEMDTPAHLEAPQDQIISTREGIPLVSTGGHGKLVLLTGATGPGNFKDVEDFYGKIIQNRLGYAKAHG
jgi:hypothetical protein